MFLMGTNTGICYSHTAFQALLRVGSQFGRLDCLGMCSPGLQPTRDDETREVRGCQEMSGVELSRDFFLLTLFILLPAPLLRIPMAISSPFEVVLGLPAAGLTIVGLLSSH